MILSSKPYEFRCPIYGFIELSECERAIIEVPAFQRLRRIKQLAFTDYVYPGAMHTRFEHSLGVMHMATLLYDNIVKRCKRTLEDELQYDEAGLKRYRQLVRFAALLHDVGHSPFSHASEDLYPKKENSDQRYKHEDYSAEIVRQKFGDVIDGHDEQGNHGFKAEDVARFLEKKALGDREILWRDLIDGQMDADRMDYLLRDSHHAGVSYGRYDWQRLVNTVELVRDPESEGFRFGVSEGGWHAAEALILARYFMFTQVYFHKTRVAYDHHLREALREILPSGHFPPPEGKNLDDYLKWDDWRVLGLLSQKEGGEHGQIIFQRKHFRKIADTPETPSPPDIQELQDKKEALGDLLAAEVTAKKSWYKSPIPQQILVVSGLNSRKTKPLTEYSDVIKNLPENRQTFLYVKQEHRAEALSRIENLRGGNHAR